jgi:hypothetical protein
VKRILIVAVAAASLLLIGCGDPPASPPLSTTTTATATTSTLYWPPTTYTGLAAGCYSGPLLSLPQRSIYHNGLGQEGNTQVFTGSRFCGSNGNFDGYVTTLVGTSGGYGFANGLCWGINNQSGQHYFLYAHLDPWTYVTTDLTTLWECWNGLS